MSPFRYRGLAASVVLLIGGCFDPSSVDDTATTTTDPGTDSSGPPADGGPGADDTSGGSDDAPLDTGESTTSGADESTSTGPQCEPSDEVCDGIDNDCDDAIDNDNPGGGKPCETKLLGECTAGTVTCENAELTCVQNVESTDELCDGLDNNCDGTADEGNPVGGVECKTKGVGVCGVGETSCAGKAIECVAINTPTPEVCDGLDNNCDGTSDEGNPGGGALCSTGLPGVCEPGLTSCETGESSCVQQVLESAEVCDNLDNNCDGTTDEGNPGGGGSCLTGLPGICSPGTYTCAAGPAVCTQNQTAQASDTCGNGLDDDCDGTPDDGCAGCPHGLCEAGAGAMVSGCDPCVTQVCAADSFCCSSNWDGICVGEVATVCGSGICSGAGCAHLICEQGAALASGCDGCVTTVCASDAFCCSNSWDGVCVGEVLDLCGLTC